MRKILTVLFLVLWVAAGSGQARASGVFSDILEKVEGLPWAAGRERVEKSLAVAPFFKGDNVLVYKGDLLGRPASLNYLFASKGGLYNLAWYAVTQVSDIQEALKLEADLEKGLTARYGKPRKSLAEGKADEAGEVVRQAPAAAAARARIAAVAKNKKGRRMTDEEMRKALGGLSLEDVRLKVFYRCFNFWDGGSFWVYSDLVCDTSARCFQHLQFVAKDSPMAKDYWPGPDKPFNFTPLYRDQDRVIRANSGS